MMIEVSSCGIFCSLPYHADGKEDGRKAKGDVGDFVTGQVR
jgi:hypothetical protein